MLKSVKLHFSVRTNILDFLKSEQIFSGALEFSFVFKALPYMLKNTVLSKTVKIDFWEKNAFLQTSTKCFHANLLLCQTMSPTLHGSIIFKKYCSYIYKNVT